MSFQISFVSHPTYFPIPSTPMFVTAAPCGWLPTSTFPLLLSSTCYFLRSGLPPRRPPAPFCGDNCLLMAITGIRLSALSELFMNFACHKLARKSHDKKRIRQLVDNAYSHGKHLIMTRMVEGTSNAHPTASGEHELWISHSLCELPPDVAP